jgi:hydrogenase-4 component B
MFSPAGLVVVISGLLSLGAITGLLGGWVNKQRATHMSLFSALVGSLGAAAGTVVFWLNSRSMPHGEVLLPLTIQLPTTVFALALDFYIDRLAAFFLFLTGFLSAGVSFYSCSWLADKAEKHLIAGTYNLFILSTVWMLLTNNSYFFLIFLEFMTLTFGYLTLYRHNLLTEQPPGQVSDPDMDNAKLAFKVYLIFSHVGVVLITVAFVLLGLTATDPVLILNFDELRANRTAINPQLASIIFLLALSGFGVKAAMFPFQTWMGLTHPYLPTNIHALVSAIVIKVAGVYGLLRVLFEFLPQAEWWWGAVVIILAGLTAISGVFYAITSRDLKTALANHSVENIGIILAGMGLAVLLSANRQYVALAHLALIASLYHLLNHTIFKGLLFLGTGAIESLTGTVKLDELGGLIHRFRWTAVTFLVGAISISGFPPFNGFISEWLTLQAIFATQNLFVDVWITLAIFSTLLMLGSAFALTAVAFVKIVGETLLGQPRLPSTGITQPSADVDWSMRAVLVLLAVLCLLLGIFPGAVTGQLSRIATELIPGSAPLSWGTSISGLDIELNYPDYTYTARVYILPWLVLITPLVLLVWLTVRQKKQLWQWRSVWNCGSHYRPEWMQVTGPAFSFLIWEWASINSVEDNNTAEDRTAIIPWRIQMTPKRFVREIFRQVLDTAIGRQALMANRFGKWFQSGDIRRYLAYLFIIFLLLLAVYFWSR